jgi:hypothetical protein
LVDLPDPVHVHEVAAVHPQEAEGSEFAFDLIEPAGRGAYPSPNAREMSGFGLCPGLLVGGYVE